jgi:two-component system CheB/CheR fusion protein
MKKSITKNETPVSKPIKKKMSKPVSFPIVGIGASAGGLEALEHFFTNVPQNSGLAFVVIQHLDPNHLGMMPELLQRKTDMKVLQATDYVKVQPNHIYVIPPNKTMSILNGFLHLFEPIELHGLRLPIDYFFHSLADDMKEKSIGVILSGMGSDGSSGLKDIKGKNGITLVQDPEDAKFDGMPKSALKAVHVDILAAANELPKKLMAFLKSNKLKLSESSTSTKNEGHLQKIALLLRSQTGHDFSLYKNNTLNRRIERRMNVHQITSVSNYVRFLTLNPSELDILFKELLIGVTDFFRDTAVWEKLKEQVLPELFEALPDGYTFRAWVTACSTGEEAYSLAIILREAYKKVKNKKQINFKIFASDIDDDAIQKARKGLYSKANMAHVSADRLRNFFVKEDTDFRIASNIREMIVFATHSVVKDPPFTKLDLIFCRNLLIYMKQELQEKLMSLYHYSLKTGGIMVLGSAENINSEKKQFQTIDLKLKIYKNLESNKKNELLHLPNFVTHSTKKMTEPIKPEKNTDNIQILADQLILQQYAPASVLINGVGDILYITGRTGKYLEPVAGKANWNIYAMAREGLANALPRAIRKIKESRNPLKLNNLKIGVNGGTQFVNITLQLIDQPETIKGCILIVFKDVVDIPTTTPLTSKKGTVKPSAIEEELKLEVLSANEEIQIMREEMLTAQEELKSTNEELQSTNEELQSTNEELTTSKEEMQSLNEELHTVNVELQTKVADYVIAENDMKNLLNSTNIATLFLDKELNIRRFTEQLTDIFKLRESDIGRPFTDLVSNLNYPNIKNDVKDVLKKLVFKEVAITTTEKKWFSVRIMPYRTIDDHIGGIVITFVDISESKKLEAKLNKTITLLRKHNIKE